MRSFAVRVVFAAACAASACGDARREGGDAKAEDEPKDLPAQTAQPEPVVTTTPEALLAWLDPDAVSILYADLPTELDTDAFAVIFALPPKLEGMLRDVTGLDTSLRAILPPDTPAPSTWLHSQALATQPRVGAGTYVLRRMAASASVIQGHLEAAGMQVTTIEGYTVLVPERLFPWKVALLDEHVLAFVPGETLSSGLRPLTAARDFPPSDVETQLREVFANEADPALEIYGAGPLLHLDLDQELAQIIVQARRMEGPTSSLAGQRGLDVVVQLLPLRDLDEAATALQRRDTSLETDQVQAFARRVQFGVDGQAIVGRLQLTANDLANLRRRMPG